MTDSAIFSTLPDSVIFTGILAVSDWPNLYQSAFLILYAIPVVVFILSPWVPSLSEKLMVLWSLTVSSVRHQLPVSLVMFFVDNVMSMFEDPIPARLYVFIEYSGFIEYV